MGGRGSFAHGRSWRGDEGLRLLGSIDALSDGLSPLLFQNVILGKDICEEATQVASGAAFGSLCPSLVPNFEIRNDNEQLLRAGKGHVQSMVAGKKANLALGIGTRLSEHEYDHIGLLTLGSVDGQTLVAFDAFLGEALIDALDLFLIGTDQYHITRADPIIAGSISIQCVQEGDDDTDMFVVVSGRTP